ncbi:hypothetical protein A6R68_22967, partial [Neotoma lepida]
MKGARFQEPVSMVTHHLAFWDISHSEQGPNLNRESEANTELYQLNHNPRLGLDILEVVPISKSEALQRSGRAGRTASGKCFRIYSKDFWNQCMPDHVIPEIKRTSLTSVVLTLKCLAIHDVIRSGHVTRLGLSMVEFPLPPHLTCAVIKAASLDCEDLLLPIAAMLSVENVFIRPVDPEYQKEAEQRHRELAAKAGGFNDFATLAVIFEQCKSSKVISQERLLKALNMKYYEDVFVQATSKMLLEDGISKEVLKKMQRRNDDKSISDARARFLERKQQRIQDH